MPRRSRFNQRGNASWTDWRRPARDRRCCTASRQQKPRRLKTTTHHTCTSPIVGAAAGQDDQGTIRVSDDAERHLQLRHLHAVRAAQLLQGGGGRGQPGRLVQGVRTGGLTRPIKPCVAWVRSVRQHKEEKPAAGQPSIEAVVLPASDARLPEAGLHTTVPSACKTAGVPSCITTEPVPSVSWTTAKPPGRIVRLLLTIAAH